MGERSTLNNSSMQDTVPIGYVPYEYLTANCPRSLETVYKDSFYNFGWQFEDYSSNVGNPAKVNLRFKRNRRIANRSMVMELQRKCEKALEKIDMLEKSKKTAAFSAAMLLGIIGCGFLAGSVFAVTAKLWVLMVILGALGFLGWLGGYLAYVTIRARRSDKVAPLIDKEYEIVYETTEHANALLNQ